MNFEFGVMHLMKQICGGRFLISLKTKLIMIFETPNLKSK